MENVTNMAGENVATLGEIHANDAQLATFDEIDKAIISLKGRFDGRVYDMTTTAGMKDAKADRFEVRNIRTDIERNRKDFKAVVLARGRLIDSTAKKLTDAVRSIEDPIHDLIQKEEARKAAEKAERERLNQVRIDEIRERINELRFELTDMHSSDVLSKRLADLIQADISEETYQEFFHVAGEVFTEAMKQCRAALQVAQDREAVEADRLARQKEEDERLAAEKIKLARERKAFRKEQAEKKAEDDRIAAEQAARDEELRAREAKVAPKEEVKHEEPETVAAEVETRETVQAENVVDETQGLVVPDHGVEGKPEAKEGHLEHIHALLESDMTDYMKVKIIREYILHVQNGGA